MSRFPVSPILFSLAAAIPLSLPQLAHAITTDAVADYAPGSPGDQFSAPYQNGGAPATGLPSTLDASFDPTNVTPFTPAYDAAAVTLVRPGGHITLHFAQTVSDNAGRDIGVFGITGIAAGSDSSGNSVVASAGPATFSESQAIVSVSQTGAPGSFVALNNGLPIPFNIPANAFLNSTLTYDSQFGFVSSATGGTTPANFLQPFNGSLADFSGLSYTQILALLNGSAGGTWLDLSTSGLPSINYIRFDVPADADYQFFLDGVTAVPEPASLGLLSLGSLLLLRRRSR
jgi:hypothetical protein